MQVLVSVGAVTTMVVMAEQWDWLTQAEDVRDNILSLVASKRKHWHRRMRGRKGHGQGSGRHSRSCRKLEECGCP